MSVSQGQELDEMHKTCRGHLEQLARAKHYLTQAQDEAARHKYDLGVNARAALHWKDQFEQQKSRAEAAERILQDLAAGKVIGMREAAEKLLAKKEAPK